ncbi:MAG: DUF3375 family protein, partial [Candidatus Competibacteraceae bacterium]|nr:DUF3375 family protein [Candidatus Competibacteraceae bacterium]
QVVIDKERMMRHIRHVLQDRSQITLGALCQLHPLRHGLAELVTYLELAGKSSRTVVDEDATETITWQSAGADGKQILKRVRLPRVIFVR